MLILAVILAIFVYGLIAAKLGTILPNLLRPLRFDAEPERQHRFCAGGGINTGVSRGGAVTGRGGQEGWAGAWSFAGPDCSYVSSPVLGLQDAGPVDVCHGYGRRYCDHRGERSGERYERRT